MATRRRVRYLAYKLIAYFLLITAILVWALPVLWVVLTSLKPRPAIFTSPPTLIFSPTLENYIEALTTRGILESILNSSIITLASTSLAVLVAVPAAYAYASLRFRLRTQLTFYTLFTQMAPPIGLLVPFFLMFNRSGLLNTYAGLIIIYLTITVPFSVWIMISYFEDVPKELEEAALVDGASRFTAFVRVVLPQVRGGIAVTTIFAFINSWNEFIYAVVLTGPQTQTATVAIFSFLAAEESRWGPFTATGTMIMFPIIVVALVARKQIVRGLSFGGIKG